MPAGVCWRALLSLDQNKGNYFLARCLPPASFRFSLTTDTLALGYVIPLLGLTRDLHPLDNAELTKTPAARCIDGTMRRE